MKLNYDFHYITFLLFYGADSGRLQISYNFFLKQSGMVRQNRDRYLLSSLKVQMQLSAYFLFIRSRGNPFWSLEWNLMLNPLNFYQFLPPLKDVKDKNVGIMVPDSLVRTIYCKCNLNILLCHLAIIVIGLCGGSWNADKINHVW